MKKRTKQFDSIISQLDEYEVDELMGYAIRKYRLKEQMTKPKPTSMNLLKYLSSQAGGNQQFFVDKRADGWRIKPRSFGKYSNNNKVMKKLKGVDGIKSAQVENCSMFLSMDDEALIVRTTMRPKDIQIKL